MEKKVKELQAACDDMRKEIAQRLLEAKTLREDLDSTQRQYNIDNKEFEIITEEMEKLKVTIYCKDIISLIHVCSVFVT